MKTRFVFFACLVSLALGTAAGYLASQGKPAPRLTPEMTTPPASQGENPSAELAQHAQHFGYDERITRLFSSLQQPVELFRKHELAEALRGLTTKDMAGLVRHVQSLSKMVSSQILPALIERWFQLDPTAAAEWVKEQRKRPELDFDILRTWAKADSEGAIRCALSSPKEWRLQLVLVEALNALHGKDFTAKVSRVLALPAGPLRDYAFVTTYSQWAADDPAAAFAAFERNPPDKQREELRNQILESGAQRDPEWAFARMEEILPSLEAGVLGNELVGAIASAVAGKDPRKALDWLGALPEEFRAAPAIGIGREWALKEPVAALEWCMEHGVDITRADWKGPGNWQPSVLGGIMENAPKETFERLAALPAGPQRDSLLECAFMESMWHTPGKQLYADNDAMARAFYNALPEESQIAKAWLFGEKRAQFGAVEDAAAWAREFPTGLARSNAIAGMMSATQARDPERAEKILGQMGAGSERDAALRGLATAQAAPLGVERALSIGDSTTRQDTLDAIVPGWLSRDGSAARAWVQKAAVPEAWKQQWLRETEL